LPNCGPNIADGPSIENEAELEVMKGFVTALVRLRVVNEDILLLAQHELQWKRYGEKLLNSTSRNIDSFHAGEKPLVALSTVQNKPNDFLNEEPRMCVGVS
jgi:hypothetical protein